MFFVPHPPKALTKSRYSEVATFVVPVAASNIVNQYLVKHGLGESLAEPIVIGTHDELVEDAKERLTHRAMELRLTPVQSAIVDRLIAQHAGQRVNKLLNPALVQLGAKRDVEAYPYQVIAIVRQADRAAIITEMEIRWPAAGTRFFLTGLSVSGAAPITHRLGRWKVNDTAIPLIQWMADNAPKMEILIANRNGANGAAMRAVFNFPKYKSAAVATRLNARVWLRQDWTLADVLNLTNLKIIP